MKPRHLILALGAVVVSGLCAADAGDANQSAGAFTLPAATASTNLQPASVLSDWQRAAFLRGRAGFNRPWVVFGISTGDWGVGPTFVADRCSACHERGGRGVVPKSAMEQVLAMVVRISQPGSSDHGGPKPLENYGEQLQNLSLQGQTPDQLHAYEPIPAEAEIYLDWNEHQVVLADGTAVNLRSPRLRLENPAFGRFPADMLSSLRIAQPVFGLGLLAAVPDETLHALAAKQREAGFNGRLNQVWDAANHRMTTGRFGWKASQPTLRQQIAAAAIHDMGVTSNLFFKQNCPPIQVLCRREVPGNDPELSDAAWEDFEILMLGSAVPARRPVADAQIRRGAELFESLQCAVCHVPTLQTTAYFARLPQLSNQTFHPYTDLLLHDMGEGLADHRPDFAAGARDWRTPPLWGLGLARVIHGNRALLHDGRARDFTEAILWHGGEAQGARDAYARLPAAEREALEAFLKAI